MNVDCTDVVASDRLTHCQWRHQRRPCAWRWWKPRVSGFGNNNRATLRLCHAAECVTCWPLKQSIPESWNCTLEERFVSRGNLLVSFGDCLMLTDGDVWDVTVTCGDWTDETLPKRLSTSHAVSMWIMQAMHGSAGEQWMLKTVLYPRLEYVLSRNQRIFWRCFH